MKMMRLAALASALAIFAVPEAQAQIELAIAPFAGGTMFLADPPNRFALGRRVGAPLIVDGGAFDAF